MLKILIPLIPLKDAEDAEKYYNYAFLHSQPFIFFSVETL